MVDIWEFVTFRFPRFLFRDALSDVTSLLSVNGKPSGFSVAGRSTRAELVLVEKGLFSFKHSWFPIKSWHWAPERMCSSAGFNIPQILVM